MTKASKLFKAEFFAARFFTSGGRGASGWFATTALGLALAGGCADGDRQQAASTPEQAPQPAAEPAPFTPRVAETGVGVKGRKLERHQGVGKIVATPAVEYFRVKEKIVFEIQIPHAMNIYTAINGKIKSHEQFMKEIIEANQIELPELPPGQTYEFRPLDGKLWVVPEKGAQP